MRLSVVMGQAGKVLGAETPHLSLPLPSILGDPSSDPCQASSSPLCTVSMVSYSHFFQALERDTKLALRKDSVQLTQSPLGSGELKTHTE